MTGVTGVMPRLGLCSVTLRHLDVAGVLAAAVEAGLECVEWGADIHVPAGDEAAAARVRAATEEAGLAVASYGSYYRAGARTRRRSTACCARPCCWGRPASGSGRE